MLGLTLPVVVASGWLAGAQAPPPVFRAEVYVVHVQVSLWSDRQRTKPITGVTVADVKIVLDKKTYVPVEVRQDVRGPGYYLVNFSPPDELRDGKTHKVEIRIRKWRIKQEIVFPNAAVPRP